MPRDVSGTASGLTAADGSITLTIPGPHRIGTRWSISSLTVESTRAVAAGFPTAAVYRSAVIRSALLGKSRTADAVTFDGQGDWLLPGDQLLIVIENTEPASRATVNLYAQELP